jgi:glycerol kinase
MQIQSNLLQVDVIRPETTETTALGAAFFAGLASGYWPSVESLSDIWKINQKFNPEQNEENQKIIDLWNQRISKVTDSQTNG